jgi:N-acetylglucosaminyldiphosphoundecaprenol N-acetyl-beta-D-mannosaminyltransferase
MSPDVPHSISPSTPPERWPTVDILGVRIHNLTRAELLRQLDRGAVFTPNVDFIMKMQSDPVFHAVFHQAEFRVCDSRIVQLASRWLGTPILECIPGSDFFGAFCAHHAANPGIRVFLLGAAPGVAEQARRNVNARIGREVIVAAHSPSYGFEHDEVECRAIVDAVNASGATVLAVGVGAPKQEHWIMRWRAQMPNVRIQMGIGATLDFEAGVLARAPRWMNRAGLEWAFRLWREPRRLWKRYLVDDLPFFLRVARQKRAARRAALPPPPMTQPSDRPADPPPEQHP